MEVAQTTAEESLYGNLNETRHGLPAGYPTDNTTNPNERVAAVNGSGYKVGPSLTLKVMAGDKFTVKVSSWYKLNGNPIGSPANQLPDLLTALLGGVGGVAVGSHGVTPGNLLSSGALVPGATDFLTTQNNTSTTTKPQAFLNWILFDEQFKMVSSSSGFDQVGADQEFKLHTKTDLPIDKNGYLYIYVSNNTTNLDVFFDNLQVTHTRGAILEETHYYPFGLTMAGISVKAAGSLENKKKFNGYELNTDFDLNFDESFYRTYDPQIGRFLQIDPVYKYDESPYISMGNNPISNFDPLGNDWFDRIAATICSIMDNLVPGCNMREYYKPTDPKDFNQALQAADASMLVVGAYLLIDGGRNTMAGGTLLLAGGTGGPILATGLGELVLGADITYNVSRNMAKGYNYGTEPNNGIGPKHGSDEHNNRVDEKIDEVRQDKDNTNIRKNQTQHDKDGNKVGNNRPDVQWDNKKTGHNTHEVDTKQKSSDNHKKTIKKNDPKVNDTYEVLPTPKYKPIPKG